MKLRAFEPLYNFILYRKYFWRLKISNGFISLWKNSSWQVWRSVSTQLFVTFIVQIILLVLFPDTFLVRN